MWVDTYPPSSYPPSSPTIPLTHSCCKRPALPPTPAPSYTTAVQAARREVWATARADIMPRFDGLGFRLGGPDVGPTVQQILKVGSSGRWQMVCDDGMREAGR